MKTELIILLALAFCCSVTFGAEAVQNIAAANNAFAADLYGKLSGEKGNLFLSPYSIETALAMTYAGARGQTAEQMGKTLHLDLPADQVPPAFAALIHDLNTGGQIDVGGPDGPRHLYQLVVANALWGQSGYPFHKPYQDLVRTRYEGELQEVDFAHAAEQARQNINNWVAGKTNDKIKDLIGPGMLSPSTRLVLTNAIYFKSNWASQFSKAATKDAPFHVSAAQSVDVPMMHQQHHYAYAETDRVQVVDMPYMGFRLSMAVILPKTVDGLPAIEKALTQGELEKWLKSAKSRKVELSLPRFKFSSQFSMADTLKAMGMTSAFSPDSADFSGIATVEKLFLSAVIHKAYVDVNEEGTEAAAATGIAMAGAAMPRPEEPVIFNADHPFLFVIRHSSSGAILFMGRVENLK